MGVAVGLGMGRGEVREGWVGVVGRVGVGEVWNTTDIRWQRGGVNVDLVINVTSSRPGPVMMSIIHIYL